jgi:hypothetical protein
MAKVGAIAAVVANADICSRPDLITVDDAPFTLKSAIGATVGIVIDRDAHRDVSAILTGPRT